MLGSHVLPDRKVRFRFHDNSIQEAAVAGNFSEWRPVGLAALGDGWWGADIGPMSEENVFYKFATPHGWSNDQFNYRTTHDGQASFLNVAGLCGHLLRRGFFSPALGRGKNYLVYLPPAYAIQEQRSFPVLYLMGGLFESETGWVDKGRVEERLDQFIVGGQIEDMIVVMSDKDDAVFNVPSWDAYLAYLVQDLPAHVESEYRTLPVRGAEGLSLGAGWAVRLGLSLPDRYCSISGLSGHYGDEYYQSARGNLGRIRAAGVRFRLACGSSEGHVIPNNESFARFLQGMDISCEFRVDDGPHDWPLWEAQIGNSLLFHDYGFKQRR